MTRLAVIFCLTLTIALIQNPLGNEQLCGQDLTARVHVPRPGARLTDREPTLAPPTPADSLTVPRNVAMPYNIAMPHSQVAQSLLARNPDELNRAEGPARGVRVASATTADSMTPTPTTQAATAQTPVAATTGTQKKPDSFAVEYDIYRDRNPYPIDPRKPLSPCTQGAGCSSEIPGLYGHPYQESEPGGCTCGKRNCSCDHPYRNVHWPRPFSVCQNERHPNLSGDSRRPRIQDRFDCLRNFKLINYNRTDNGYCGDCNGRNRDPYGCLGESQHGVTGIGFRPQGQPLNR